MEDKTYKALYEDETAMEIFHAENDNEALEYAWSMENEFGALFNLFEVDKDYNEIRTIM